MDWRRRYDGETRTVHHTLALLADHAAIGGQQGLPAAREALETALPEKLRPYVDVTIDDQPWGEVFYRRGED